jgi:hypothetical protein
MLHEGPSSINFKYWIDLKMFPAKSLISKGICVCFDHVLPESFWLDAVIIQKWSWLHDHAAISEALCLFCKLCKTLFNSEIKRSNYVSNGFHLILRTLSYSCNRALQVTWKRLAAQWRILLKWGCVLKLSLSCCSVSSRCLISISWFILM